MLRRAERQGLMTGRRLSEVQSLGLEILMLLDQVVRGEESDERLRQALLTINPDLARGLYPAYFTSEVPDDPADVALDREDTSYDFRRVEWESPQEMGDEDLEMLRRMLGDPTITVSSVTEAPEGVEGAPGLREPDEPEWT